MPDSTQTIGCTFYSDIPLKHGAVLYADSEFTGPPMLAAFFVTATISIVAVLFAYLSGALDESSQNFVDAIVLSHLRDSWYGRLPERRDRQRSLASTVSINQTRSFRREGITQFVLALSDQQLVTGVAILLAALANLSRFNRYEIIMIHSLAWFSATTHLATLDVLSPYLEAHKIVQIARTAAIIFLMILLSSTFVIRAINAMVGNEMQSPAWCPFNATSPHVAQFSNWHGPFNVAWQSSWTIALLLVLFGYLIRIQALYSHQRHPFYALGWLLWLTKTFESRYTSYRQMYAEKRAGLRYQRIIWVSGANGRNRWMPFGYDDSFLSSIPGILFSFSYGISQLISVRRGMNLKFITQTHSWGFGEIVALLLLSLPFMAAGATLSEYRQRQSQQFMDSMRALELGSLRTNSTVSTLQHHSLDEDVNAIDTMYEQKSDHMKQYFCKEVNLVARAELQRKPYHTAQCKQSLLNGFAVVEQCEQQISIAPHVVWFCVQACGALTLGALLNAGSFDAAGPADQRGIWFSISVLTAFFIAKAVALTHEIVMVLRFKI